MNASRAKGRTWWRATMVLGIGCWILAPGSETRAEQVNAGLKPGLICIATGGGKRAEFLAATPNFTLNASQSIHPRVGPEFSAKWEGFLKIERRGIYRFWRGNAGLRIEEREVAGDAVALEPGYRKVEVMIERRPGPARFQLEWESDYFKREPVPYRGFFHRTVPAAVAEDEEIQRGQQLFVEFNCSGCHAAWKREGFGRGAPDLSNAGHRLNSSWIGPWLENPRKTARAALMPALALSGAERADIAAYLKTLRSGGAAKPVMAGESAVESGRVLFGKIGCTACHSEETIPLAGLEGKWDPAELAVYLRNPLAVDPAGGMPDFLLSGEEAGRLAAYLCSKKVEAKAPAELGRRENGRALVISRGCLNCHTLREGSGEVKTAYSLAGADRLEMRAESGCLADSPPDGAPRYDFAEAERRALRAFVRAPGWNAAPLQEFAGTARRLRCVACHELDGPAGLALGVNEGPPPLSDAGNKLRRSWLVRVITEKKRVRPWLGLRMPNFGRVAESLIDGFAAHSGAELGEGSRMAAADWEKVADGIQLIGKGDKGLGCITCHDFRGHRAGAELHGPEMTEMADRIRAEWIFRWWRDPSRLNPGTPMPSFFSGLAPAEGEAKMEMLAGTLALGAAMPTPDGLTEDATAYLLRPKEEPIVFRSFVADLSPRAIAVGLPGMLSYCFDARTARLGYAWAGDFLDARPVWADRGGMPPKILGKRFYTAPGFSPVRIGGKEPERIRFRGYQLREKVPEFHYEVDGILVKEWITKDPGAMALVRSLEIGPSAERILFYAGADELVRIGSEVKRAGSDGWVEVAGNGPVRFQSRIEVKRRGLQEISTQTVGR